MRVMQFVDMLLKHIYNPLYNDLSSDISGFV